MLDDVFSSRSVKEIRDRRLRYLDSKAEFEVLRHDGAYRILMGLSDQPKHGAKIRKADAINPARPRDQERIRAVHTAATSSGAIISASAEFSERRDTTIDFLKRSILLSDGVTSYANSVRVIFTDRARDLDDEATWRAPPCLLAVASGPLHRCLEVEACSGGKITRLSTLLRRAHQKFSPQIQMGAESRRLSTTYFSTAFSGAKRRIARTRLEISYTQSEYWSEMRCDSALAKLEDKSYVLAPYVSRAEYVGIVSAILHSPKFADQMARRRKDANVATILRRAIQPENAEYLLNGSRFLCMRREAIAGNTPVGTATNEAVGDYVAHAPLFPGPQISRFYVINTPNSKI